MAISLCRQHGLLLLALSKEYLLPALIFSLKEYSGLILYDIDKLMTVRLDTML